jgi:hypothetical protein
MTEEGIPLVEDVNQWEDENPERAEKEAEGKGLSNKALMYMEQIKDLQQQLTIEYMKVERLEMAIRGYNSALKEEIAKG